ncbi:MAG TPA: bifunctional oligoribonuclease/PAP phosphatase NrnA [candidate division Zixibacteria bacterium]|nr:bifunctional oligoribonuclease/PAP phosphatase NrnA [candidate division Zixibacteria bacterium]MDD4918675.1 bifunctional oligoribonuclease/PAP phosphatase NrnA [candidate division Zixibacteria bacterium]MDM7973098.1 bifunctional oligoribonuclease/PAP phosphatase NrnA [candidate division Zixibacteria bacterium]HOD67705.1 bifunctional oligoribonuclease/PAP phosphatase NrnA [candidate division Zixibacteria bacterium]HOZ08438.1 bifunctional oligoribonuclease/PAP phosphatase NrnA [candidate divis
MKSRAIDRQMNDRPGPTAPPLDELRALLERSRRVLVVAHVEPDGDAIGSLLACGACLRNLGKETVLVRESEIPSKYRFLRGAGEIRPVDALPVDLAIDTAVVLECPTLDRVGRAARFLTDGVRIINIDHHRESGDFGAVNWIDPTKSSVGEMLFELYEAFGCEITPEVAEQLYTAIMTDTGRFRYPSTSPRTMEIVGRLIAAGADPKAIADNVYYRLSVSTMRLTGMVLASIEFHDRDRLCLLTLTQEMLEAAGAGLSESDGLVDFTLFTDTAEVGALLKEVDEDRTRVSLRSRDAVNVAALAAQYGGGGHFNAAGCTMPYGLARAREEIIRVLTHARKRDTDRQD